MKKNIICLFISLFVLFSFNLKPKSATVDNPVTFTLIEKFYSTIVKKYENNTTVFYYTNNLLNMNLTNTQLKDILSQKPGNGSSRLTYYETLNIKVKPVEGTNYESLKDSSTFYRANGGGSWVTAIEHNQDIEETANEKNLNNDFWPYGYKIQFRTSDTDAFTSTVPNGADLSNKTLEEQLATVLNIDLSANPNGVVEKYKTLWRFNPLPNNYTYLLRFDFLDKKDSSAPQLKASASDEYLTNSLKLLGTEYVAIKYDRTGDLPTSLDIEETKKSNYVIPTIITFGIIIIVTGIYMYKKRFLK